MSSSSEPSWAAFYLAKLKAIWPAPRRVEIASYEFRPAPDWMQRALARLIAATGHRGKVEIVTADPAMFKGTVIGVTANPHAFARIGKEGESNYIVLPHDAEDNDRNANVICHEFAHILFAEVDRLARLNLPDRWVEPYMRRVEASLEPFVALLQIALIINVTYVRGETE